MSRGTCVVMHLDNLRHNLQVVRDFAPSSRIWAVVKANGYGHGLLPVARVLAEQADGLAVATLDEGLAVRDGGLQCPVLLLEGVLNAEQSRAAIERHLDLVIHTPEQVDWLHEALDRLPGQEPLPRLWVKVDTGMHRLGLLAHQVVDCVQRLPAVQRLGYMTHFACADETTNACTSNQAQQLSDQIALLPDGDTSLANSAGVLLWPSYHGDWVRPGIMLYGASPCADRPAAEWGLRAVMTLTAPIIALRDIPAGDTVGYGATFKAERPMRVATVAIGYADGYPRHAPTGTPVAVRGHKTGTLGRVSMDMLSVDVTDIPGVVLGDNVELWGRQVPVDDVARATGTIGYELLTRLSVRGETRYLNG